jgi:uncharacterized membrane protein YraQ (UPF0718 family)
MDKYNIVFYVLFSILLAMIGAGALGFFQKLILKTKQKARLAELEEKKCKGAHKWITMKVEGQMTHVCRECCYAPVYEGFVKDFYVEQAIFEEKYQQNYKIFFDKKIEELSIEFKVDLETMKKIGEKIVNIKKDHSSVYLQDLIKEITQDMNKSE